MEFHEVANVFPLLEGEEFRELCEDIEKNGQQQPILTYEGKILDGRNRYRACVEIGEEPWVERWVGGDPIEAVKSLNLYRRHMSVGQKSTAAAELAELYAKEAKKRQGRRTDFVANLPQSSSQSPDVAKMPQREEGKSRDRAASEMGVSPRSVQDAKKLKREDPEAYEAVKRNEISLSKAMEPYRKPKPEPTVRDAVEDAAAKGESLELPSFDLPPERKFYKAVVMGFKDTRKLNLDAVLSHCKGPEDADRQAEALEGIAQWASGAGAAFREKSREYRRGNLKAVND